jgi:hypothetical protein
MANYDLDEVVEQSPVVEDTTGQEEVKIESEKSEEVPETGETSEEVKTEETKEKETKETEVSEDETKKETTEDKTEKPPVKKASDQFTTDSQALKAAENLAIALREDEKMFKKMTIEQVRAWYDENRPRIGAEGFKGDRSKAKELNKTIDEEDKFTRLEAKLDNFLETQKPKTEEKPETEKPLVAPAEPEFDEERYNDLLLEDPKAAAQMMRDFRKAQTEYTKQLINFEGGRLIQALTPHLQTLAEGYEKMTQREQEEELKKANDREWKNAEKSVRQFIEAQPKETFEYGFDDCEDVMKRLMKEDWPVYKGIIEADGKERAIFRLYQDALKEKKETAREARLAQLEQEIAALKNGETIDQINAAKGAARITTTNGGVTQKTPQKPLTPQEIFEIQMRGNSLTRSKYDIEI